jgi:hypothetical protein
MSEEILEFDFAAAEDERPIMEHWRKLEEKAREEFSEENLCLAWVTESDGRAWKDWWKALREFERNTMLMQYRSARNIADITGQRMRPYRSFLPSKEEIEQDKQIIDSMVREIKHAALERRPMPIRESDDMNGWDRYVFRARLAAAFNIAGVVLIAPAEEGLK